MHKFDKILVHTILCCSQVAYLIVVTSDHFHFVYFGDQCNMLSKNFQIYEDRLLRVHVNEL